MRERERGRGEERKRNDLVARLDFDNKTLRNNRAKRSSVRRIKKREKDSERRNDL